jgi:hypothetical protein
MAAGLALLASEPVSLDDKRPRRIRAGVDADPLIEIGMRVITSLGEADVAKAA